MEASALEQRLRDRPGDTAAWLAYGERLAEQGDPRGELIRLEHRRARTRPADRPALDAEIAALVKKHEGDWDEGVPPDATVVARLHGFPAKVAVEWNEDAPVDIEEALRLPFVTALQIEPEEYDYEDEDEDDEPSIETGALATLDLGGLVELDLAYLPIGSLGAETLAVSAYLRGEASDAGPAGGRIERLDLRYGRIGDTGLAAIAESPSFGGVRRLYLQANGLTAAGMPALHRFAELTELDLRYNAIGADGVRALLDAPFIGSLKRLFLNPDDIGKDGAALLARAAGLPPTLRSYWRNASA